MRRFFVSDTHFSHKNIITYERADRFTSVEQMNAYMIEKWNSVVSPADIVYHAGDFAFGPKDAAMAILRRLNGTIHLIRGNHDRGVQGCLSMGFASVENSLVLDGGEIFICHRPSDGVLVEQYKNCSTYIYGHVHSQVLNIPKGINVSVEAINYTPIELYTQEKEKKQ